MVCWQLALVDLLKELGVEWEGMVGHSTGEIACGYADGSLSREQTMLLAFHRGDVILQALAKKAVPEGSMVAVGLSWEAAYEVCLGTKVRADSGELPGMRRECPCRSSPPVTTPPTA